MDIRDQEDELLRNLFRESTAKSESEITEGVMKYIDQSSKVFEYKPVISKKTWMLIVGGFLALITFSLLYSTSLAIETPALVSILTNGFQKLQVSFTFDFGNIRIPQPSSTMLIPIVALNVMGVFLIISYKWGTWMFKR